MKEKKYVYITILSAEGYLKGVLGLNKSLRRVKSKYGLVVLISPDISQKCEDILKNENIKAIRCSDIEIETDYDSEEFNYWKKTFFKFRIFEQTDFDRVTYLDSDMIIQYNIDHLFENEEFTAVSDVEFCYNNPNAFGINSGMMVFTPKDEMTERLVELCVEYKKKCSKPFGDQEVINEYLKVNEIPVHYLSVK